MTPPTQVRQKVASPDTPVHDLFPQMSRIWRSAYSLHVLNVHLQDFAQIGVADEGYILRGVRLLAAVLIDRERPLHHFIFAGVLSALTKFLQGV